DQRSEAGGYLREKAFDRVRIGGKTRRKFVAAERELGAVGDAHAHIRENLESPRVLDHGIKHCVEIGLDALSGRLTEEQPAFLCLVVKLGQIVDLGDDAV